MHEVCGSMCVPTLPNDGTYTCISCKMVVSVVMVDSMLEYQDEWQRKHNAEMQNDIDWLEDMRDLDGSATGISQPITF